MKTEYILLWFEAPMQSWGFNSKFGRRDTLKYPTRSGVLGLVCSAMGATGEQVELLQKFSGLKQTVIAYSRDGMGTTPNLRDFQMIGGGYDSSDPWQDQMIPRKADGNKSVGGGSKLTYRYYIQNATFAVILEVPKDMSQHIAEALQLPVYEICLGRKCCVPTDFVYQGVYNTEAKAYNAAEEKARAKAEEGINLVKDFKVVDGASVDGHVVTLSDVPIQFGSHKKYGDRQVTEIQL